MYLCRFGIFQFVRPELQVGPLEGFRFNGVSLDMICIEGNEEVLFFYELLGPLVDLVQVHGDSQHSGCLTDYDPPGVCCPSVPPGIPWLISPLVSASRHLRKGL